MDAALKRRLEARFGEQLTAPIHQRHDETEIRIGPGDVPDVCRALHDEPDFRVRPPGRPGRRRHRHVDAGRLPPLGRVEPGLAARSSPTACRATIPRVPSVTFLWQGAEWMEREAYDMFGITFEGNRDLRRIYMPPDYQSFPLRKDFFLRRRRGPLARRRRPPHGAVPRAAQRPGRPTMIRKTRA